MSDTMVDEEIVADTKSSKLPMIIGLVLALAGGGGGFFAVQSGLLGGTTGASGHDSADAAHATDDHVETSPLADVAFIEVPPLLVSLNPNAHAKHLRFRASLEVPKAYASEVESILPRVQDVLNSYLRALEPAELEAPGALINIRGQMLRRIRLVAGEGRVRDLLVLEFVLN